MDFKKVSQISWMVLAVLFIVALFRLASAEAHYVSPVGDSGTAFIKINKRTGEAYILNPMVSDKWAQASKGDIKLKPSEADKTDMNE